MYVRVKVFPESKKEVVERISSSEIIIKTRERPIRGRVNLRVSEILQKIFPDQKVELIKGGKSKNKVFKIHG